MAKTYLQRDTAGTPQQALVALAAPTLVGPFPVAHDDAGINSQVALMELPAGTVVLAGYARVTSGFTSPTAILKVGAGGSGALINGDWQTVTTYGTAAAEQEGTFLHGEDDGAWQEPPATTESALVQRFIVGLKTAGYLVCYISSSETTGEADIYALVVVP